jgi:dipeptidyl aminopeptidase/acylaminoacyl peptidase
VVYQDAAPTFAVDAATDQGGETSAVLALDLSAREPTAWWTAEPPGAQLDQVLASPRGGLVAVHVDAGNRSTIRLLDAKTLREKVRPDLPLGTTELGDFTPDGRTLTFSLSTPDRPGEPFALDGRSGKKRPLRADPRPGLGALAPVEVSIATIPAFDGKPIPVHVYLPKGRRNVEFPVIVEFHGGPAASSSIGWKPRTRDRTIRAFRGPNPTPSCGRCARGAGRWST